MNKRTHTYVHKDIQDYYQDTDRPKQNKTKTKTLIPESRLRTNYKYKDSNLFFKFLLKVERERAASRFESSLFQI